MKSFRGFKGKYFSPITIANLRVGFSQGGDKRDRLTIYRALDNLYTLISKTLANKACHCNCIFSRGFLRFWSLYKHFFTLLNSYFKTKTGTSPPI